MKDVVRFDFVEAEINIQCVVCDNMFDVVPFIDERFFNCPKCNSPFEFYFGVNRLSREQENARMLRGERYIGTFYDLPDESPPEQ